VYDDRKHINLASISPQAKIRTITVNSFSKSYAMTGWRLGYNIASPDLTRAMLRIAEQFSRSAATFVQYGGVKALSSTQESILQMVSTYSNRRDYVTDYFRQHGINSFNPPEGTFFIFLDIRAFKMKSVDMANFLLNNAQVVTIPGDAYGSGGEGFIRLSFAYDEKILLDGIKRIIDALKNL
jgi:aminotransferase